MILMTAQQKKEKEKEKGPGHPEVCMNSNLIGGIINLLDWESEYSSFETPLKNDGSNDLAAPDKDARRISL